MGFRGRRSGWRCAALFLSSLHREHQRPIPDAGAQLGTRSYVPPQFGCADEPDLSPLRLFASSARAIGSSEGSGLMRVALTHYWLLGMRGGEKVLEALCRMYPE